MNIIPTAATAKIAKLNNRIRIVQGGTSAGKTFAILQFLISYAYNVANQSISIVAESIPHIRRGALRDFKIIATDWNHWRDDRFNKSTLTFTFENGSYIEFFSADQPDKLRGSRRDVLFINECNNVDFDSYQQLAIRTRKFIFLDFNPTNEFWVDTELQNDRDAIKIILTYKDNSALSQTIVNEIEKAKEKAKTSEYWANWWKVYGEGQRGTLEGVIFSNWRQIDKVPDGAILLGCGLDFGYSNDPTALIEVYEWNGKRVVNELLYKTGLLNTDIARFIPLGVPVYADSAEPKSIEEIKRAGIKKIMPVTKGADSINYGIQLMQGQDYLITKQSVNLIKELRGYCWDKDKTNKTLNKPCGADHGIDGLRYFEIMTLSKPQKWGKIFA